MSAQVPAQAPNASAAPAIVRTACPGGGAHDTCGFLRVPLDRRLPDGRKIRIYFELRSRADRSRPPASTVLSIEGGPGFSTTADRSARIQLWRPLSARRDLLLVDLRGTGRSDPLDCTAFRRHILGYIDRAARCAAELGTARDFYDTSQSVQDLAAVLGALRIGRVDLYGDSYGSYAAQAFALRYPHKLRSLVLDGLLGSSRELTRKAGAGLRARGSAPRTSGPAMPRIALTPPPGRAGGRSRLTSR